MGTNADSDRPGQRREAVVGELLVAGALIYVWAKGISILAEMFAPGLWGYLAVGGLFTGIVSLPLMVLMNKTGTGFMCSLLGWLSMVIAQAGGEKHWSGWGVGAWLAVLACGYLLACYLRYLHRRLTGWRALQLLRRQRGDGSGDAWSYRDWEWAYAQIRQGRHVRGR